MATTRSSPLSPSARAVSGIQGDPETSQSVLKFLPEPHTDFIFAVTAENTALLAVFRCFWPTPLLLSRMIAGARQASDQAGMLVIMAIVCGMVFQIFMNVGMALGICR